MSDAIIGGAIAAVVGAVGYAVIGLLQERRREKAQRLAIVDALVIETAENLIICNDFAERELCWTRSFKVEAYNAYKGQLFFLSKDVFLGLASAVFRMEEWNTVSQIMREAASFGQSIDTDSMPTPKGLMKDLEFVNGELHKWKAEHSRSLAFRVRRGLRNLA